MNEPTSRHLLHRLVGSCLGLGYMPRPRGTLATAFLTLGCVLIDHFAGMPWWWTLPCAALLYPLGIWAAAPLLNEHDSDPSWFCLDELVGVLLTLTALGKLTSVPVFIAGLAAFLTFRTCDAFKPGPVGWVEQHFRGATGVMLDDVAAALMAWPIAVALCAGWAHFAIN